MKIRTDFVTNSSSSSFIAVKIQTNNQIYLEKIEGGGMGIRPTDEQGYFHITEAELKELSDTKQLLQTLCKWIFVREADHDPDIFHPFNEDEDEDEDEDIEFWEDDGEELKWDVCEKVIKYFSVFKGDYQYKKLPATMDMNKVKRIAIFSRMEYWDEPYGASLIEYDYKTGKFKEQHRNPWKRDPLNDDDDRGNASGSHYPSSDPYGDKLEEQFEEFSFDEEDEGV